MFFREKLGKKLVQAKKIFDELFDTLKGLHNNFGTWHGWDTKAQTPSNT